MPTITSGNITFIDLTDTKKIDLHITSNHPTVQIYDQNNSQKPLTPDWEKEPLVLTPVIYIDSELITDTSNMTFTWTKIEGSGADGKDPKDSKILTISTNVLTDSVPTIRYRCTVEYNNGKSFSNEISFSRVYTGKNGSNGYTPQKGVDYFDGQNGKSVSIKGVAYTDEPFVVGAEVNLYSVPELGEQNKITIGGDTDTVDGYLVDGYLCVYTGENFIWTGKIQGPKGEDGKSTYLFTRYANDQNGNGFSESPIGKKYIGFYRYSEKTLPSNVGIGYDNWTWAKYIGDDAKSISLSANSQVFRVDKDGKVSPSTLIITPQAVNTSITKWEYNVNGGTFDTTPPAGVGRGSDGRITVTGETMTANSISIRMGDGTYSDTLTIYKVYDGDKGADASVVFLTNENITFAADANGQITGVTVNCDVVAYTGTTPVTPTVGVVDPRDIPNGMTLGEKITESNKVTIPIIIADNATLGSSQSTNGEIVIPIISPIRTDLRLTWSKVNSGQKGEIGVGIKSTTVTYGVSDSASTNPDDITWQTTIPVVADGKYLWTRTFIDYTDDAIPEAVTFTYAKQGVKGDTGSAGSSITVSKIEYQAGTSATIAPTGTWSNNVVSVAEGNYLWTKTTFSDNKVAYGVAKQGKTGDQGIQGVQGPKGNDAYTVVLTNESHIFAGDVSNAIAGTAETQILAYNGSTTQSVTIISVNGKTATTTNTDTGITGLKFKCSALSGTNPKITFTCTTDFVNKSGSIPIVISVGGIQFTKMFTYSIAFKGSTGAQGATGSAGSHATAYWLVSSASVVQKTSTGTIAVTPSTLTFTGKAQTGTNAPVDYACRWIIDYSTNGTTYTNLATSTANETSKTVTVATTYKTIRARMYLAGGTTTLLDEQIIPIVSDGTSASLVDVTPSALYFKSNNGKDGTFAPEFIYLYPRFQNAAYSNWQYSTDGGVNWVSVSGANGLAVSTYSSIPNALRISRTSTLYTDSITSISFRCNSATNGVYDTVSVAKIYDVIDISERLTTSLAEVKTTTDSIASRVTTTETSLKTTDNNVSSLTTRVSAAEQKITADAIVSTVTKSTTYTNDLGKKVNNNEIISKINQTAESITISANKIGLLGATNIPDLTADKIKGGTLTLGGTNTQTQNGQILVKNSSNEDMISINQYGMAIADGNLMIVDESELNEYGGWSSYSHTKLKTTGMTSMYIARNSSAEYHAELDAVGGLTMQAMGGMNANPYYLYLGPTRDYISDYATEMKFYDNLIMTDGTINADIPDNVIADISMDEFVLPKANIILQDTAQKNIQFQNASKELRSCMLYAGANDSTTVMGAWDTTKSKSIFTYSTDNKFYILDSEAVTKSMMQSSVGERGYQKLPSGLIIQWGYQGSALTVSGNYNLTSGNITLPIAFPNSFTGVFCNIIEADDGTLSGYYNITAKANGLTGFTWKTYNYWNNWGSSILFSWMAIGY